MVNAQEWLDRKYPKKERSKIVRLDINNKELEGNLKMEGFINLEEFNCFWNNLTDLDLSDCIKLTTLRCYVNLLASTAFLTKLPNPQKLTHLDIGDNNFLQQDLTFLNPFVNLEKLYLWTLEEERLNRDIYNRFGESLEPLKDKNKLKRLGIINTDIEDGLEFLSDNVEILFDLTGRLRREIGKRNGAKVTKIQEQLLPFNYNFIEWKRWINLGFTEEEVKSWKTVDLKTNEYELATYLIKQGFQLNISNIKETIIQESWRDIHEKFNYQLRKEWEKVGFNKEQTKEWVIAGATVDEYNFICWLRDIQKVNARWILNNEEEFKELRDKYKYFGTCKECNQPNVGQNWCQLCNNKRWKADFFNWTSGNSKIDQFIQKYQLERITSKWNILEWIPYEQFTDVKYLTQGGFSKIYKAKWTEGTIKKWSVKHNKWKRESEKEVVLKSLTGSQNVNDSFLQELNYYKIFKNETSNMVPCYGISRDLKGNYIIVMEYMKEGNLREYLKNKYRELSFKDKLEKLKDISKGLKDIHEQGLMHCDFHLGNILYPPCNITDLGLCQPVRFQPEAGKIFGVLPYVAPEVLQGKPYTQSSDVYSFGIVSYEILTGLPPYHGKEHDQYLTLSICRGERPQFQIKIPQLLEDLIKQCWNNDILQRPPASELSKKLSSWYNEIDNRYHFIHEKGKHYLFILDDFDPDKEENNISEFAQQVWETEEYNQNLSEETRFPKYEVCSKIYHSKLINTKQITEKLKTTKYSQGLVFDFGKINLEGGNDDDQNNSNWTILHSNFTEESQKEWQSRNFTLSQARDWLNTGLQPTDSQFASYLRDHHHLTPEEVLNHYNEAELRAEYQNYQLQSRQEQPPKNF